MSETILQIKRSTTTSVPANLQPGELAYTSNGQVLFIGSPEGSNTANVIAIAGERNPGVLTANQALVANSSAWIDNVQTAKLILGPSGTTTNVTSIVTDGALASVSNNTLATAWAVKNYIDTQAGSSTLGGLSDVTLTSVSNNQIVVYDAISGQWENHSISGTSNEVEVTFDGQDITVGLPDAVTITSSIAVGTVAINGSSFHVGNSTVNTFINSTAVAIDGIFSAGNTTINGSATITGELILGSNLSVNTTHISVGNSTVNTTINAVSIDTDGILNVEGTARLGNTTIVGWANVSQEIAVGANLVVNTAGITIGNSTVNAQFYSSNVNLNGTRLHVGDATNNTVITGVGINATGNVNISGSANVASHIHVGSDLLINTTAVRVGNTSQNTTITTQSVTTNTVVAANIVSTGNTSIAGDLYVDGDVRLGNNSSDKISYFGRVNTHIEPASNTTFNLGSDTLQWANVYGNNIIGMYGTFQNDVTVSGNLTVTGSLVTINVSTLSIVDPLIQLASNNTVDDSLDIGFFGSFNTGGGAHEHAGLFRDASDGEFKLFTNLVPSPTTTVDTANNTYTVATLNAYLKSGALVSNSSALQITANSTVAVSITANSLTLSSALTVPNGGTGATSFTNNAVLLGNTAGALKTVSSSTQGHVLQIDASGIPTFAMLDGGTF